MVEIKDKRTYFDLIRDFEYIPFSQSEGWHDFHTCLKPNSTRFFVDNAQHPTIALFGHVKKFFGLKMLMIEGECFKDPTLPVKSIKETFLHLTKLGFHIIEIDSCSKYQYEFEREIRRAGYKRPVGLFSTPCSILVNTSEVVQLDRNWKRNIEKGVQSGISVLEITDKNLFPEKFEEIYNEMSHYKGFGYQISSTQIKHLLWDTDMRLFGAFSSEQELLALRVAYVHKRRCNDVLAANRVESRKFGATHLLLNTMFNYMKNTGIEQFDFARVLNGYEDLEKVATFKNGIKGEVILYNGEWSWYKYALLRPTMYFVKKFLFKRVEV